MNVQILASGSQANFYLLSSGSNSVLLDCGLRFNETKRKLNFNLPDAILLTHEHSDHAQAANAFLKCGVDVFTTQGTADALNLHRHNLHVVKVGDTFHIGGDLTGKVITSYHDAKEPCNFIVEDSSDRLLYLTDTGEVPADLGNFSKILIEANHLRSWLWNSSIDAEQKHRILKNHLCVEKAIEFLKSQQPAELYLIHISQRHGNWEEFKRLVEDDTNCKVS